MKARPPAFFCDQHSFGVITRNMLDISLSVVIVLAFSTAGVLAQPGMAVTGAVLDETGAALPGVTVTLTDDESKRPRETVTDSTGPPSCRDFSRARSRCRSARRRRRRSGSG
jgi:hypothetical protein